MAPLHQLFVGTAGWQLPKTLPHLPASGSQLERYARLFNAVEINSTFYRPHLPKTFERWAATVPLHFRFAVKMFRGITHEHRLADVRPAQAFLEMVGALGDKLGPVLVQLPPSLQWSAQAEEFLLALREGHEGVIVLEARHPSWAAAEVQRVLERTAIGGVAADPPLLTDRVRPGGDLSVPYFRMHGNPRVYWSPYGENDLQQLARQVTALLRAHHTVWTIFDNTAAGAAAPNALRFRELVQARLADSGR